MRRLLWVAALLVLGVGSALAGDFDLKRQRILDTFEDGRFDVARNLLNRVMAHESEFDPHLRLIATHLFKLSCELPQALDQAHKAAVATRLAKDSDLADTAQLFEQEIQNNFGRLQVTVRFLAQEWDELEGGNGPIVTSAPRPADDEQRVCMEKGLDPIRTLHLAWAESDDPGEVPPSALQTTVWLPVGTYRLGQTTVEVRPNMDNRVTIERQAGLAPVGTTGGSSSTWLWAGAALVAVALGGGGYYLATQEDPSVKIEGMSVTGR